jgi:hypothetical protein
MRARRSAALSTTDIKKLSQACGTTLGFAGALRRSELVGLNVTYVTWTAEGLKLLIERSKTDKEGEGAEISIPLGHAVETCPVRALQAWLGAAKIKSGPLFPEGQSRRQGRDETLKHGRRASNLAEAGGPGWAEGRLIVVIGSEFRFLQRPPPFSDRHQWSREASPFEWPGRDKQRHRASDSIFAIPIPDRGSTTGHAFPR